MRYICFSNRFVGPSLMYLPQEVRQTMRCNAPTRSQTRLDPNQVTSPAAETDQGRNPIASIQSPQKSLSQRCPATLPTLQNCSLQGW